MEHVARGALMLMLMPTTATAMPRLRPGLPWRPRHFLHSQVSPRSQPPARFLLRQEERDPAYHPYGLVLSHNNNVYSGFTGNHYATGLPGHSFAAVTHLGKREAEPTADADAEAEADPYY